MSAYISYHFGQYSNAFYNLKYYMSNYKGDISKEFIFKIMKDYNELQRILMDIKEYIQNNNIDMPFIIYNGDEIKIENFKDLLNLFYDEDNQLQGLFEKMRSFGEGF